jgi:predicted dehydrogenase/threonine dehydrogenase-like Zn-dependent dehydrogenase
MKQVVQNFRTGELKVEEFPPPVLKSGGVLVRTACSLISPGTERSIIETAQSSLIGKARERPDLVRQVIDTFRREGLRSTYGKVKARLDQVKPLGYSASGCVAAIGKGVDDLKPDDLVACAGAGYASHAEVIFVPQNLCVRLPAGVSPSAGCYATVGAIALHGVRQAGPRLGETVAVIGMGLVGQLTLQILKAAGCRVLAVDIDSDARDLAARCGADATATNDTTAIDAGASLTAGRGVDSIVIAAGTNSNEPIQLAGELARDRATVVVVGLVGMDVPRDSFYAKEIELKLSRSYGPGRYDPDYEEKGNDYPIAYVRWTEKRNMEAFLQLVADKKVDVESLTTHRFPVERAAEAYDLILGRGGERRCGVILEYPPGERSLNEVVPSGRAVRSASGKHGVSFIGAGNFARGVLLPIVRRNKHSRLVGVAAATGVSAKKTAEQFGFSYSATGWERAVEDDDADCVFIATRHDTHASIASEALRRGKSVFVEKPLATTADDLRKVIRAARESRGLLMVGFNRRFAPLAREVHAWLAPLSGPATIVYRVNAGQLPPEHWSHDHIEGGGRVIGEVCHFVDFVQFITGGAPVRVSAESVADSRGAGFVDDSITISLALSEGSVATIIYSASGDASAGKERVEIFRDRGVATIDDFKTATLIRGGKTRRLGGGSQDKGHKAEVEAFLEAAREGKESPIPLGSLAATTLVCFAAVECARTGSVANIDLETVFGDGQTN